MFSRCFLLFETRCGLLGGRACACVCVHLVRICQFCIDFFDSQTPQSFPLNSMNAVSLYVSASRLLFNQSDSNNANYSDLYRLVPYLRQSLSCTVCANLLVEPYSPEVCQHHVCRQCFGGRKNLKPTCSSCRSYDAYNPNPQLRTLLQCYKNFCNLILNTPNVYSNMHKYVHVDGIANGTDVPQNLAELIDEGAQFHDEYKSNSGLAKSKISILPCIFTNTSSSTSSSLVSTSQGNPSGGNFIHTNKTTFAKRTTPLAPSNEAPSFVYTSSAQPICVTTPSSSAAAAVNTSLPIQSTLKPNDIAISMFNNATIAKSTPIRTVSNGSSMYSVLYTGSGSKITIKRKNDDNIFTTANTMSTKDVLDILSRNPAKIIQHPQIQQIQTQKQIRTITPPSLVPAPKIIQPQTSAQLAAGYLNTTVPITQNFKKPAFALKSNKTLQKRKGCRCGNATPTPGKLTCCGQRCPCYVESKSCVDCKCRGCRNPHRLDGLKVSFYFTFECVSKKLFV